MVFMGSIADCMSGNCCTAAKFIWKRPHAAVAISSITLVANTILSLTFPLYPSILFVSVSLLASIGMLAGVTKLFIDHAKRGF